MDFFHPYKTYARWSVFRANDPSELTYEYKSQPIDTKLPSQSILLRKFPEPSGLVNSCRCQQRKRPYPTGLPRQQKTKTFTIFHHNEGRHTVAVSSFSFITSIIKLARVGHSNQITTQTHQTWDASTKSALKHQRSACQLSKYYLLF